MKKIYAALVAMFMVAIMFAPSASATGNGHKPEVKGKDVTLCHYAGSNNNGGSGKYTKMTIDINGWLGSGNSNSGHKSHTNDIWEAFTYIKRTGSDTWETVNVPAQGDTSRLAFENCKTPDDDEKVAKPEVTYADPCGTKDDVFSVAPGRGYTVGDVVVNGGNQSITVTLNEDFVWADGSSEPLTFTKPVFTDEDCDLPETGGVVTNTLGGLAVIALLAAGGLFLYRRRGSDSTV